MPLSIIALDVGERCPKCGVIVRDDADGTPHCDCEYDEDDGEDTAPVLEPWAYPPGKYNRP